MNGHDETPNDGFNGSTFSPNPNGSAEQSAMVNPTPTQPVAPQPSAVPTQKRYIKGYEQRSSGRDFSQPYVPPQPVMNFGENADNIVLPNKPQKPKNKLKKFMLIGGVVGVILIAAIVVMMQYFSRPSLDAVKATYSGYLDYLINGPREENNVAVFERQNDTWLFFSTFYNDEDYLDLNTYIIGDDEEILKEDYLNELKSKFEGYVDIIPEARLGSVNKDELIDATNKYEILFNSMLALDEPLTFSDELFSIYQDGGLEATSGRINEVFPENWANQENILGKTVELWRSYYNKVAQEYNEYNSIGCVEDDFVDYGCTASIDNKQLSMLSEEESSIFDELQDSYLELKSYFIDETEALSRLLGVANE